MCPSTGNKFSISQNGLIRSKHIKAIKFFSVVDCMAES